MKDKDLITLRSSEFSWPTPEKFAPVPIEKRAAGPSGEIVGCCRTHDPVEQASWGARRRQLLEEQVAELTAKLAQAESEIERRREDARKDATTLLASIHERMADVTEEEAIRAVASEGNTYYVNLAEQQRKAAEQRAELAERQLAEAREVIEWLLTACAPGYDVYALAPDVFRRWTEIVPRNDGVCDATLALQPEPLKEGE